MKIFLLFSLLLVALAVKPPTPLCRISPLPSQIPITVGEELRFDLENVFSGYNLFFNASAQSHITVAEKYQIAETPYPASYNFRVTKIKAQNRFLGLVSNGAYSGVAVGVNDQEKGVTIQFYVEVENISFLHCYDVDEIMYPGNSVVIVDCGVFYQGELAYNEFIYVNLTTRQVIQGSHLSDTFVNVNFLSKRRIEVVEDPFSRIPYLVRFLIRDGVSAEHKDQTYAEVFLMLNPLKPQLLDVIDHTFLNLPSLSIADYQIHMNRIYILAYNRGLFEISINRDQYVQVRSKFDIKLDLNRFRVDQLGFNDDLNLVMTNGNTVYQFEWDLTVPATMVAKYTLVPNSAVEQIFVDYNFVIVLASSVLDEQLSRRTWVFTRRTLSYLNAYNVFHSPLEGPAIIHWDQHGTKLQIFHLYSSYSIKMSLPYMDVKPVDSTMAGKTEEFTVLATSIGEGLEQTTCEEKFKFIYLLPGDQSIIKTGLWNSDDINVDSPDNREIPLAYEFFGFNLTYEAKFESSSPILPFQYINKQHQAVFNWPTEIIIENIEYFEMFTELSSTELKPDAVYGLVQVGEKSASKTLYTTYYIKCKINVLDRDETHHLTCQTITKTNFSMGKIVRASQIFNPRQRRIALVFDNEPHTVYIYHFWDVGFGFYGRKDYAGDAANQVTGVAIANGKLFTVLEYGKRVEVFNLEDLQESSDVPRLVNPRMVINSNILRFFGVDYFAPVNLKVSRFHKEAIFLKTKTGVMAINVNDDYLPELLFHIKTTNIRYDFEINEGHVLIITEISSTLYELQTPLRRVDPPLKRQSIDRQFKIGDYDEVCSDRLFYIVGNTSTNVINPRYHSTSAFYADIWSADPIISVDAVNIEDKEILFIRTKKNLTSYVFAEDPKLIVEWHSNSADFKMSLSAMNVKTTSDAYTLNFNVLDTNETIIKPTPAFNETHVKTLGKIKVDKNVTAFNADISFNDTEWFDGNVLRYRVNCTDCGSAIKIVNHVEETRELLEARAIYDMESTIDGIYAQQYSSILKTYTQNDSIHFINQVPTERRGEVCSKLAVGEFSQYVISLCELGTQVNIYITSIVATKPFTFGPYASDAKAVNHAKIVGDILMIVDNDDNPFLRAGGIYLYHLNFDFEDTDFISFLDYIDYEDLQIEGFVGVPYIGSADLHTPYFNNDDEYRLFLTEARTGSIFVFGFEVSADGEEVIYLTKKFIDLNKFIPKEVRFPSPLKIHTINIHYFFQTANNQLEYYFLLSVANWHHMELMITFSKNDDIINFKLERLFERFPWELGNYLKYRRGRMYETYFAVPYINNDISSQILAVYSVPFILDASATTYEEKYSKHEYYMYNGLVPVVKVFGAHYVRDPYEIAFAFHTFGTDKLLFTDVDGYNITEFTLNKNISISVRGLTKPQEEVTITALNPYTNFTFTVDLDFHKDKDEDEEEKEKEREEILWIIIVAVGGFMIVGLVIAFAKQSRKLRQERLEENKQTILTVEDDFKNNYIDINRSSADPDSNRGSLDNPLLRREFDDEEGESKTLTR